LNQQGIQPADEACLAADMPLKTPRPSGLAFTGVNAGWIGSS